MLYANETRRVGPGGRVGIDHTCLGERGGSEQQGDMLVGNGEKERER